MLARMEPVLIKQTPPIHWMPPGKQRGRPRSESRRGGKLLTGIYHSTDLTYYSLMLHAFFILYVFCFPVPLHIFFHLSAFFIVIFYIVILFFYLLFYIMHFSFSLLLPYSFGSSHIWGICFGKNGLAFRWAWAATAGLRQPKTE